MDSTGGERSNEFYEKVLASIHDAVYTLDATGQITWVNEVAIEEFDGGYDRSDLIGSPVTEILPERDIEKCVHHIKTLLEGERQSVRCEVTLLTAENEEIPVELRLALLPPEDGKFQGTVGVARDITERKRREQHLMVLNRILRHNLRNDLNVIQGHATGLSKNETLTQHQHESVTLIREVTQELIQVSEKAQTLETLLEQENEKPDRIDCVERVARLCRQYDEQCPEVTIETSLPPVAYGWANETFELAIDYILENAIEHSDTDSLIVQVDIADRECDDTVEVTVSDNGPGIPEHEFRVLEMGEESPLEHSSGLGLWLVTWIASTLNGNVTFSVGDSGGTEVRFEIPRASADG